MTKYVVQRILGADQEYDPRGKATVAAGSVLQICRASADRKELFVIISRSENQPPRRTVRNRRKRDSYSPSSSTAPKRKPKRRP
ncbi:DUF4258 domain-containing protein [Caenorhabditis elegans]|uniref:DUF4258 domain-containing protein n=1 Tax=Caenorhabditis elegans TaxID=6239 RepID=G5ECI5_CAEEL|nr:DUF4258 domain-containing protein [Caenorhabditis elegans]NP_001254987.1 DUF4258 domain-containing protein [Caenorhabditis elegans]CCA65621.1 DUF4258 domain-containing protein [Caenorhabditis elegans]CCA65622.1 DUF4258 domain-containing protein [Caenorhabditis elegans]|eukprot:NP_001254986.1 Uncharacterized protein CELE_T26G10.9 [Caenorhabditis elegans]